MKASELRSKDATELSKELESLLKAQFNLRMQRATQQLSNTSQIGKVRRDIARVRTIIEMRSEEHTSELQSLMRISYAVFCLKKKMNTDNDNKTNLRPLSPP